MAEVIKPLSLEVAALAASQQQQQLALETLAESEELDLCSKEAR